MLTHGINKLIDHTLLKAEARSSEITGLCQEAIQYEFFSVCVSPCYVSLARQTLQGQAVKVCTVVGFPLGASETATKAYETSRAIRQGADEIDMVLAVGALKSGNISTVREDIRAVVAAAGGAPVKVILETSLLTHDEKILSCRLALEEKATFVKTSTGFGKEGATVADVRLLRETVGREMGVKASGGIRDWATAQSLIEAGANRLGTSSGPAIVEQNDGLRQDSY